MFDLIFGKFSFLSKKEELQEVIKVRQDSLREKKRWALPSQPDFLENGEAHAERAPGAPGKAVKAKPLTGRSPCFGWGSCCWLGLQERSDEQEAVRRRAGTSVQLANSPPGSLASMVPQRLPVQQLIPKTHHREKVREKELQLHCRAVTTGTTGLKPPSKSYLLC